MKRILTLAIVLLPCLLSAAVSTDHTATPNGAIATTAAAQNDGTITPDGTYMFAQRDTCELYMDIYEPAEGSETTYNGKQKPTILYMFGSGFISGAKDEQYCLSWYRMLVEEGYRVIAIDYRLGLKGAKDGDANLDDALKEAIYMAIEDLFSATAFIIDNSETLGIDPDNIVISGSSSGAITVLQAELELCNRTSYTSVLPQNFQYAGVLSFAGMIMTSGGKIDFAETPCPILLFHGTKDNVASYKQLKYKKLRLFGSSKIADILNKHGYNYSICRYEGHQHEIAGSMSRSVPEQLEFIQNNIMSGTKNIIDITIPHNPSF